MDPDTQKWRHHCKVDDVFTAELFLLSVISKNKKRGRFWTLKAGDQGVSCHSFSAVHSQRKKSN